MRFEVIMKSETRYKIFDNERGTWCASLIDGKSVSEFSTREQAFEQLKSLDAGIL